MAHPLQRILSHPSPPQHFRASSWGPTHSQHPAIESIAHQVRAFQQHLKNPSLSQPLQLAITSQKSLALDHLAISRDGALAAKELFSYTQTLGEDVKDATDRLAFLNYQIALLHSDLAEALDNARRPLKDLRGMVLSLEGKRNRFNELTKQGTQDAEIFKVQFEIQSLEKEFKEKKKNCVVESEKMKWEAYNEFSSKLQILNYSAGLIIKNLTSDVYSADLSTKVRSQAQASLEHWSPLNNNVQVVAWPKLPAAADAYQPLHEKVVDGRMSSNGEEWDSIRRDELGVAISGRNESLPSDRNKSMRVDSKLSPLFNPILSPPTAPQEYFQSPGSNDHLNLNPTPLPATRGTNSPPSSINLRTSSISHPTPIPTSYSPPPSPLRPPSYRNSLPPSPLVGQSTPLPVPTPPYPTIAETGVPLSGGTGNHSSGCLARENSSAGVSRVEEKEEAQKILKEKKADLLHELEAAQSLT